MKNTKISHFISTHRVLSTAFSPKRSSIYSSKFAAFRPLTNQPSISHNNSLWTCLPQTISPSIKSDWTSFLLTFLPLGEFIFHQHLFEPPVSWFLVQQVVFNFHLIYHSGTTLLLTDLFFFPWQLKRRLLFFNFNPYVQFKKKTLV